MFKKPNSGYQDGHHFFVFRDGLRLVGFWQRRVHYQSVSRHNRRTDGRTDGRTVIGIVDLLCVDVEDDGHLVGGPRPDNVIDHGLLLCPVVDLDQILGIK